MHPNGIQRESSATIKAAPAVYERSDSMKKQNIIEIDCRGLEFTDFRADGQWQATGVESGTKFSGIDLSEGEWFDYDEKEGEEVSITDIKYLGIDQGTMNFTPVNPRPMLQSLINEDVIIRLKWGQTEYKGRLISVDSYMNIQLSGTEEYIDRKHTGTLGQVLIRRVAASPARRIIHKTADSG
ncbi:hypothetical protein DV737_g169, partial [Chaetothyriales sp. CBS 132003]